MIQMSMNGPSVNWDVLKIHSKYREDNELSKLVNIDGYGPHVMQWCIANMHDGNWLGVWSLTCNVEDIWWVTCKKRYVYTRN